MEATHCLSAGMGGIRTAGDLVLRMQLSHKMKINEAKKFVAEKLGVKIEELGDVIAMTDVREKFGIGCQEPFNGENIGMDSKIRISELLGIKINSVERFKERAGLK